MIMSSLLFFSFLVRVVLMA